LPAPETLVKENVCKRHNRRTLQSKHSAVILYGPTAV